MHRQGYIVEEIADYSNMAESFDQVLRGSKRKKKPPGTLPACAQGRGASGTYRKNQDRYIHRQGLPGEGNRGGWKNATYPDTHHEGPHRRPRNHGRSGQAPEETVHPYHLSQHQEPRHARPHGVHTPRHERRPGRNTLLLQIRHLQVL